MPEHCSCGTKLPEGAAECPHCGKPTFEEVRPEPIPREAVPDPEPPRKTGRVHFGNPDVIRSALPAAALAYLLAGLGSAIFPASPLIAYPLAGVLAVTLFRLRTRKHVSRWDGVKLGWMTGLVSFLLILAVTGVAAIFGADLFGPEMQEAVAERMQEYPAEVQEAWEETLASPTARGVLMLLLLAMSFGIVTALTAVGGLLAVLGRSAREQ